MSTLSVDTIQGKTTAGTVAMPSGHIVQTTTMVATNDVQVTGSNSSSNTLIGLSLIHI